MTTQHDVEQDKLQEVAAGSWDTKGLCKAAQGRMGQAPERAYIFRMKIKRIRTLPEAEGTLRMRVKGKRMLQECSGIVQDEHRDDPSGIVVGRTPPSFRGREVRGPSCF